jgi:hypothetical protein
MRANRLSHEMNLLRMITLTPIGTEEDLEKRQPTHL